MVRLLLFVLLPAVICLLHTPGSGAQAQQCPDGQSVCPEPKNGKSYSCYQDSWKCDGEVDCEHEGQVYDEVNCPPVNCTVGEFNCGHSCINAEWQCDGENDCAFGEDEQGCPTSSSSCEDDEFLCSMENECIPKSWKCDGEGDCDGDEDEQGCPPATCDSETEFTCNNGECIDIDWKCDAFDDCGDLSDEPPSCNNTCSKNEVKCPHRNIVICIDPDWLCDDDIDCPGGWDENRTAHNCSAECSEFRCTSGECIPDGWICDGEEDCFDGSDESSNCTVPLGCNNGFLCWATNSCLNHDLKCNGKVDCPDGTDESNCSLCEFRCKSDSKCLTQNEVCNGRYDCNDGSDESTKCNACLNDNGGCHRSLICVNNPDGPVCNCPNGYIKKQGKCYDVDECSLYGKCSQICTNTHGSYNCKCAAGYQKDSQASVLGIDCKALGPSGYVFAAYNRKIVKHSIAGTNHLDVLEDLGNVVDIAVDYKNNFIYWNEYSTKLLKKASLSNSSDAIVLVSSNITYPEGLTLDWIHQRLYWVDDGKNTVEVVNTDGTDRRVLRSGFSRPRDIVVDPIEEVLYVTDWGSRPGIIKMNTDGSGFSMLVNDSIGWPNGIALDLPGNRLYWVDGRHKVVETIKTDGSGRATVKTLSQASHPFSIAVFENLMFVSDWDNYTITTMDRFTGEYVRSFPHRQSSVTGVQVVQEALQPPAPLCRRPALAHYDTSGFRSAVYPEGTVLTIRCLHSTQLKGSAVVKCGLDGNWFPSLPVCETKVGTGASHVTKEFVNFHGNSFGIGVVVGVVILFILFAVAATTLFLLCKRNKVPIRDVGPINFHNPYLKNSEEATVNLPSAMEENDDERGSIQNDSDINGKNV